MEPLSNNKYMKQKNNYLQMNSRDAGLAFVTMTCLYVFMSFLGQSIVASFFKSGTMGYIALCSLFPALAMGVVILYYWLYKRFSPVDLTGVKKTNPFWLILSVVLLVAMFFGFGCVNGAVEIFIKAIGLNTPNGSISILTVTDVVVYTVTLALIPAVFEEMFFRGLMLSATIGAKRVYSIILTSLCFAFYHGSLTQFFYQFLFGVGLAVLAIISKSVITCIVAHFLNNFAIILLEFLKVKIDLFSLEIIAVGLVFACAFILVAVKALKRQPCQQGEFGAVKKFFLPFGVFGILICSLLILGNLLVA